MTKSSDQVDKLLAVMDGKEMSVVEMMRRLGLEHRTYFRRNYLDPALEKGLIERTIPNKPTSSKQKYRKVKQ
ncbi:MAG: Fic family protein [Parafannyhessea sp.]|uniref:Fic family protein n=1 Tax=Parafannyhessea sp. TaxID=2847324 RepID=UPI003F053FB4